MPPEPEEAALIDGCRRWQAFIRVVIPQMSSGIAAVAAILVLSVWGEFLIPLLLTSTMNAKPVTVLITEYVGKYMTNYPILAAAGVLALIPPALLALVLNKRIDMEMGLRGILRGFGLKIGPTTPRTFEARVRELVDGHPTLLAVARARHRGVRRRRRRHRLGAGGRDVPRR